MSNEYKDWTREQNIDLCNEYPYLIPHNAWTGEVVKDYDYYYTVLDACPNGWKKLFLQMCEDIRKPLEKAGLLNEFYFTQVKEKYGELRAYHTAAPQEVFDIINKYSYISQFICIVCGQPGRMYDDGWISPYCKDCYIKKVTKSRIRHAKYTQTEPSTEPIDSEKYVRGKEFEPKFIVETYSKGKTTKRTFDCTEEWNRLFEEE